MGSETRPRQKRHFGETRPRQRAGFMSHPRGAKTRPRQRPAQLTSFPRGRQGHGKGPASCLLPVAQGRSRPRQRAGFMFPRGDQGHGKGPASCSPIVVLYSVTALSPPGQAWRTGSATLLCPRTKKSDLQDSNPEPQGAKRDILTTTLRGHMHLIQF